MKSSIFSAPKKIKSINSLRSFSSMNTFARSLAAAAIFMASFTEAANLEDISFVQLPGDQTEVTLSFDSPPAEPTGYVIDSPARIFLDLSDTTNLLPQKKYPIASGSVNSANVVSTGDRTRLVLNLDSAQTYSTSVSGNQLKILVGSSGGALASSSSRAASGPSAAPVVASSSAGDVRNIDFRRGEGGEGRVILELGNPGLDINVDQTSRGITLRLRGASLPSELVRKLDVIDFATPVRFISSAKSGSDTVIKVDVAGEYDYLGYQADDQYILSVKELSEQEVEERQREFAYTGQKMSLNFQSIPVRSVLQLIADVAELNLVADDSVSGEITLRLDSVPWDHALDIVLKAKGLDKRLAGNVLMVAPADVIALREKKELENRKSLEELAPLRTEYIRVRYANAVEIFQLFAGEQGRGSQDGVGVSGGREERNDSSSENRSILSARGTAIVDERTNTIILTDTQDKIEEFSRIVEKIDVPIQQLIVEARIVVANTDFRHELGVAIDASGSEVNGDTTYLGAGLSGGGVALPGAGDEDTEGDIVDLSGILSFDVIKSGFRLGLELAALESEGFGEIVSQPKVITGDKQEAFIQTGRRVPYLTQAASGGATIEFIDAVLKLEVVPQITPDKNIIMDLVITQDSVGALGAGDTPIIDTTELQTQALVSDGETIVLGGIFTENMIKGESKVPVLGDIPYLGNLFKRRLEDIERREILIFVTPKILPMELNQ